ncbi:MAG TPA: hypothetical protein VFY48_00460 [Solirubrobacterales bacterium]|nr:hypothetical protein [Solirubrobacterales bacterium]
MGYRLGTRLGLSLTMVGLLLGGVLFADSAAAAAPGKGGQIQACYKVKGKPKGSVRVVPTNRKCRRGERKLVWSAAGPPGPQGAAGSQGASGSGGTDGAADSDASVAALETKVAALTLKVESLEGVLAGVTNSALLDAVAAVPAVESLCAQTSTLTTRANTLLTSLGGIALGGVIPLGLNLSVPGLPAALPSYVCP